MDAPTFCRIEIRLTSKKDILNASKELYHLADELGFLTDATDSERDTIILAQNRIRTASQKLRAGDFE